MPQARSTRSAIRQLKVLGRRRWTPLAANAAVEDLTQIFSAAPRDDEALEPGSGFASAVGAPEISAALRLSRKGFAEAHITVALADEELSLDFRCVEWPPAIEVSGLGERKYHRIGLPAEANRFDQRHAVALALAEPIGYFIGVRKGYPVSPFDVPGEPPALWTTRDGELRLTAAGYGKGSALAVAQQHVGDYSPLVRQSHAIRQAHRAINELRLREGDPLYEERREILFQALPDTVWPVTLYADRITEKLPDPLHRIPREASGAAMVPTMFWIPLSNLAGALQLPVPGFDPSTEIPQAATGQRGRYTFGLSIGALQRFAAKTSQANRAARPAHVAGHTAARQRHHQPVGGEILAWAGLGTIDGVGRGVAGELQTRALAEEIASAERLTAGSGVNLAAMEAVNHEVAARRVTTSLGLARGNINTAALGIAGAELSRAMMRVAREAEPADHLLRLEDRARPLYRAASEFAETATTAEREALDQALNEYDRSTSRAWLALRSRRLEPAQSIAPQALTSPWTLLPKKLRPLLYGLSAAEIVALAKNYPSLGLVGLSGLASNTTAILRSQAAAAKQHPFHTELTRRNLRRWERHEAMVRAAVRLDLRARLDPDSVIGPRIVPPAAPKLLSRPDHRPYVSEMWWKVGPLTAAGVAPLAAETTRPLLPGTLYMGLKTGPLIAAEEFAAEWVKQSAHLEGERIDTEIAARKFAPGSASGLTARLKDAAQEVDSFTAELEAEPALLPDYEANVLLDVADATPPTATESRSEPLPPAIAADERLKAVWHAVYEQENASLRRRFFALLRACDEDPAVTHQLLRELVPEYDELEPSVFPYRMANSLAGQLGETIKTLGAASCRHEGMSEFLPNHLRNVRLFGDRHVGRPNVDDDVRLATALLALPSDDGENRLAALAFEVAAKCGAVKPDPDGTPHLVVDPGAMAGLLTHVSDVIVKDLSFVKRGGGLLPNVDERVRILANPKEFKARKPKAVKAFLAAALTQPTDHDMPIELLRRGDAVGTRDNYLGSVHRRVQAERAAALGIAPSPYKRRHGVALATQRHWESSGWSLPTPAAPEPLRWPRAAGDAVVGPDELRRLLQEKAGMVGFVDGAAVSQAAINNTTTSELQERLAELLSDAHAKLDVEYLPNGTITATVSLEPEGAAGPSPDSQTCLLRIGPVEDGAHTQVEALSLSLPVATAQQSGLTSVQFRRPRLSLTSRRSHVRRGP